MEKERRLTNRRSADCLVCPTMQSGLNAAQSKIAEAERRHISWKTLSILVAINMAVFGAGFSILQSGLAVIQQGLSSVQRLTNEMGGNQKVIRAQLDDVRDQMKELVSIPAATRKKGRNK
jgi:hypothetical protein